MQTASPQNEHFPRAFSVFTISVAIRFRNLSSSMHQRGPKSSKSSSRWVIYIRHSLFSRKWPVNRMWSFKMPSFLMKRRKLQRFWKQKLVIIQSEYHSLPFNQTERSWGQLSSVLFSFGTGKERESIRVFAHYHPCRIEWRTILIKRANGNREKFSWRYE